MYSTSLSGIWCWYSNVTADNCVDQRKSLYDSICECVWVLPKDLMVRVGEEELTQNCKMSFVSHVFLSFGWILKRLAKVCLSWNAFRYRCHCLRLLHPTLRNHIKTHVWDNESLFNDLHEIVAKRKYARSCTLCVFVQYYCLRIYTCSIRLCILRSIHKRVTESMKNHSTVFLLPTCW